MELLIDDKAINSAVLEAVDSLGLIPKEDAIGRTIDINEFRRKYCGGKSAPWVRLYIFDKFPETDFANGGWVIAPHATSGVKKSIIFEYEAKHTSVKLTGAQRFRRNSMDLFAPLFGILLVALLLVDHSILNAKIEKIGKELKRYEQRYPN